MLHSAVQGNHPVSVAFLLKMGMNINDIDNQGQTPLHHGAMYNCGLVFEYLVTKDPDLDIQDCNGVTALMHTVKNSEGNFSTRMIR